MKYRLAQKNCKFNNIAVVYPFTFQNPYYVLPPLTAEYVQAALHNLGKATTLFDLRFEKSLPDLQSFDAICLFGHPENSGQYRNWAHTVIPTILAGAPESAAIIAGGMGFLDVSKAMTDYPQIDVVITGSPEIAISEIVQDHPLDSVTNLALRTDTGFHETERKVLPLPENLFPNRMLRNPAYNYHMIGIKTDVVRTAVGCNYRCKFCFEYGKASDGSFLRWQGRSPQSILSEIQTLDATIVGLIDDDLTTSMPMLDQLSDLLIEKGIKKSYISVGRIDHVLNAAATLDKMERAGFLALSFGLESVQDRTLRMLGKGLTLQKIELGLEALNKTNILIGGTFLLGSPGESEAEMMEILTFARKWNLDSVGTNRIRIEENRDQNAAAWKTAPAITGEELASIKRKIKYGQRTPFRILLSFCKLYRHKGMPFDPAYILIQMMETYTKGTFIHRVRLISRGFAILKKWLRLSYVRKVNRLIAFVLYPFLKFATIVFERIDNHLGIATNLLPLWFNWYKKTVYNRQTIAAQVHSASNN